MNKDNLVKTSYSKDDVILLLKDVTGLVQPQPTEERERLIQSGKHYCEMLPIEYVPTQKYMQVYKEALKTYAKPTALATGKLSDKIIEQKGNNVVLVSLARAGIPIGILIKRYIAKKYNINVPHYSISIIRGRGIDKNALNFLIEKYGADSLIGRTASVMAGSTETTFYAITVYYGSVGLSKTRHTVPAALGADIIGMIIACAAVK